MRPALRRFAFQLMYFWITFWTSCGLSVLGIPAPRAMTRYFAMVGLLFVSKTNGGVENRQIRIPLTLPSPSLGARVQKVFLSHQGRGRGEGRRLRELRPDDHARARAPGEGRHVG